MRRCIEVNEFSGVLEAAGRKPLFQIIRHVLEMLKARSECYFLRSYRLATFCSRNKMFAFTVAIQPANIHRQGTEILLLSEPLSVREVEVERERFDIRFTFALGLQERFDRMEIERIEVPVASGAEVHALGHVPPPKFHWLADDQMLDAGVRCLGGERQAKRPRTND